MYKACRTPHGSKLIPLNHPVKPPSPCPSQKGAAEVGTGFSQRGQQQTQCLFLRGSGQGEAEAAQGCLGGLQLLGEGGWAIFWARLERGGAGSDSTRCGAPLPHMSTGRTGL